MVWNPLGKTFMVLLEKLNAYCDSFYYKFMKIFSLKLVKAWKELFCKGHTAVCCFYYVLMSYKTYQWSIICYLKWLLLICSHYLMSRKVPDHCNGIPIDRQGDSLYTISCSVNCNSGKSSVQTFVTLINITSFLMWIMFA